MTALHSGEQIELHNREGEGRNSLTLYVTTLDLLSELKGKSASGQWKLQVIDSEYYDTGVITNAYFIFM